MVPSFIQRALTFGSFAMTFAVSGAADAQGAWVGDPGSLTGTFTYQYVRATATVAEDDLSLEDGPNQTHFFRLGVEYVAIENLAIEAQLPLQMIKHSGPVMHVPIAGAWDDGKFHTSLTDLRAGVRYQVLDEPYVALSPYLAATIPVMDYETNGIVTGGRHLKEGHIGLSVGRTLNPVLPNLFVMLGYEFTLVEKYDVNAETANYSTNRSDLEAAIGYLFLDGDLSFNLAANMRITHGGVSLLEVGGGSLPPAVANFHDPILRQNFSFIGGGASYSITSAIAVDATVRFFISGENTHEQNLYGLDLTYRAL